MTILKRHSYSAGASDPKARALQEALAENERLRSQVGKLRRFFLSAERMKANEDSYWAFYRLPHDVFTEAEAAALKELDDA